MENRGKKSIRVLGKKEHYVKTIETKIQSRTKAIETRYTNPTTDQLENNRELLSKLIMKKQLLDQTEK